MYQIIYGPSFLQIELLLMTHLIDKLKWDG